MITNVIKNIDENGDVMYKIIYDNNTIATLGEETENTHYQAIQEWVSAGNTIEEAD